MNTPAPDLIVIHEHPEWQKPLFAALQRRGASFEPFDVTRAPDADITLPIEQRKPGGLGLHLIRRLVDSVAYEYFKDDRRSRITFRKTVEAAAGAATNAGGKNARD